MVLVMKLVREMKLLEDNERDKLVVESIIEEENDINYHRHIT
jgi:hypothetical protein